MCEAIIESGDINTNVGEDNLKKQYCCFTALLHYWVLLCSIAALLQLFGINIFRPRIIGPHSCCLLTSIEVLVGGLLHCINHVDYLDNSRRVKL